MNQTIQNHPVKNLANEISVEDLDKIQDYQSQTTGSMPVDREWMILAEWLHIAGYQAYLDAKADKIPLAEVMTLIEATRKLEWANHYRNTEAAFIGAASAQAKKPTSVFKKMTNGMLRETQVQ